MAISGVEPEKNRGPYVLRAARTESFYLLTSNRDRCRRLLSLKEITEDEIIDTLVGLHLVLEIGINAFHRELTSIQIKKAVDHLIILDNLDRISFIDKTILFIYNSNFNFEGKIKEATDYHSIIGHMKKFSDIRNKLLHGSTVMTIYASDDKPEKKSPTRNLLTLKTLHEQIESFKTIMAGMRFYAACYGHHLNGDNFLDDGFIPATLPTILAPKGLANVKDITLQYASGASQKFLLGKPDEETKL
jgi:hypothetical protein